MINSLTEVLAQAKNTNSAVIAPNFVNLFMATSFLQTAQRLQVPLILSWHLSFLPWAEVSDLKRFTDILRTEAEKASVPVVLHLDHTSDIGDIGLALEAGFNSVMFDGSNLPLEQNILLTQRVVAMAKQYGASVEAELGHVSGKEGGMDSGSKLALTNPREVAEFANKTAVDALAVSIGTVHGQYRGEPKIEFSLLEDICSIVGTPLVLHGTSGLSSEMIRKTIDRGMRKINVFTDFLNVLSQREQGKPTDYLTLLHDLRSGWDSKLSHYCALSGGVRG